MKIPVFTTRQSTNETNFSITKAGPSLAQACYDTFCKLLIIILLHLPLGVFSSHHLYSSSKKWIFTNRNLDFLDLLSSNLMSSFGDVIL